MADTLQDLRAQSGNLVAISRGQDFASKWTTLQSVGLLAAQISEHERLLKQCVEDHLGFSVEVEIADLTGLTAISSGGELRVRQIDAVGSITEVAAIISEGAARLSAKPVPTDGYIEAEIRALGNDEVYFRSRRFTEFPLRGSGEQAARIEIVLARPILIRLNEVTPKIPVSFQLPTPSGPIAVVIQSMLLAAVSNEIQAEAVLELKGLGTQATAQLKGTIELASATSDLDDALVDARLKAPPSLQFSGPVGALLNSLGDTLVGMTSTAVLGALRRHLTSEITLRAAASFGLSTLPLDALLTVRALGVDNTGLMVSFTLGAFGTSLSGFQVT